MSDIITVVCAKCGRSYGLERSELSVFRYCLSCNGKLVIRPVD